MPVTVTFTWSRLNATEPSAWESAAMHYEKETGKPFISLSRDEQIKTVQRYINQL